jgi:hypothetical protein
VAELARIAQDIGVRIGAAYVLGDAYRDMAKCGDADRARAAATVVPPLLAALRDGEEAVRVEAAASLGQCGPDARDALPALRGLLGELKVGAAPGSEKTAKAAATKPRYRPRPPAEAAKMIEAVVQYIEGLGTSG